MSPCEVLALFRTAAGRFARRDTSRLAASIAFNAVLSLAPLFLILLTVAGALVGGSAARAQILDLSARMTGPQGRVDAEKILDVVAQARGKEVAGALGAILVLHFASAVFLELRDALGAIWDAPRREGLRSFFYRWSLSTLTAVGAVLLVLLTIVASLLACAARPILQEMLPRAAMLVNASTAVFLFAVTTGVLILVFRYGPGVPLRFADVTGGAILTAILLTSGNYLIGILLRRSVLISLYGAAGSLVVALLWIYYAAHLLLFGVIFTREYAERHGSRRPQA